MDALRALRSKRDTRSFSDTAVPDTVLSRVLDAARMAGSAKNRQPVRLVVVTEETDKVALRSAGDFASWIDEAPVVIVATVRADAGPRRMFDLGRHCQNLMVAAQAEGLATCPVTIHHPAVVRDLLAVPADVEPAMMVALGNPGSSAPASPVAGPRLVLADYAFAGRWPSGPVDEDSRP